MRKGIPNLIQELQGQGYDVWIYTRTYRSVKYLEAFFKAYGVRVDGIINAISRKKTKQAEEEYRDLISKKYKLICNIDNDVILHIPPDERDYESYDLETMGCDWVDTVLHGIV